MEKRRHRHVECSRRSPHCDGRPPPAPVPAREAETARRRSSRPYAGARSRPRACPLAVDQRSRFRAARTAAADRSRLVRRRRCATAPPASLMLGRVGVFLCGDARRPPAGSLSIPPARPGRTGILQAIVIGAAGESAAPSARREGAARAPSPVPASSEAEASRQRGGRLWMEESFCMASPIV
jgi:hypothetical protein